MREPSSQTRHWIEVTYSYPGMNLNSGWLSTLKLDLESTTKDLGVSLVKVNRSGNGKDWFDSLLKAYTLIGRMHDKIRTDIMRSNHKYNECCKKTIDSYKKLAIIQERLLEIINKASNKGIHEFNFVEALNSIDLDDISDDDFYFSIHTKSKLVQKGDWYA